MVIDPSGIVYFEYGFIRITATLAFTWIIIIILFVISYALTRNLRSDKDISKGQSILEALMIRINRQIRGISQQDPESYLPFVSTIFIFILSSTLLSIIPGFISPTGSLNTTISLAICVFFAVPVYGVANIGLKNYLKQYTKPSVVMLPFNIISEFSRTISLAVRLYGNVMSTSVIVVILLSVIPFIFPVVIQLLGLLTGAIQAYIFSILAIVYIAAANENK